MAEEDEQVVTLEEEENEQNLFPKQNFELVQLCYAKQSGVIYEVDTLQIGVKVDLAQIGVTTLNLFFGNKTTVEMENCLVSAVDTEAFFIESSKAGFSVPGGAQVKQSMLFRCIRPFTESPMIRLSFTFEDVAQEIDLKLPILLSHYIKPVEMEGKNYIGGWSHVGNEVGPTVCQLGAPIPASDFKIVLEDAMHMFPVEGVDQNPDIAYGVGTFVAAPRDENKEPITIACFIRIETRPGLPMFRATVRSGHKLVSDSVLYSIAVALGATIQKT